MKHTRTLAAVAAAVALSLTVAACGDDDKSTDASAERTASNGDVFDDADVEFATAMIPHHAQALTMVDLTRGRPLSPEVRKLTEQIRDAQAPEIEQMVDWLTAWGEPVPATSRDHVHGDAMGGMDGMDMSDDESGMPGMMSSADLADLEAAPDAEFEEMWLEMMIQHHEGAITMAQEEAADGAFQPALDLADSIATSQQAEIERMKELLDR